MYSAFNQHLHPPVPEAEHYTEIELTKAQIDLLKKAQVSPIVNVSADDRRNIQLLVRQKLLSEQYCRMPLKNPTGIKCMEEYTEYRLTDKGRMWLLRSTSDYWKEFRAWITLFIAAIGLVFSAISLAIDAYQLWIQ